MIARRDLTFAQPFRRARSQSVIGSIRTVIVTLSWLWHRPAGAQSAGAGTMVTVTGTTGPFPCRRVLVLACWACL
jgi:hypothetical protein